MPGTELDLLKQKLHSSRLKHVYNALVEIRTRILKQNNGKTKIIKLGLVPRFIKLLELGSTSEDQSAAKVLDVTLSIVGNLCMEEDARKEVCDSKAIPALANILCTSELKSVQNRCARCLANVAMVTSSWEPIHKTEALEKIVKLLKDSDDQECQQTYIRAIRLLGQTRLYVQKLLDMNAVNVVMSKLTSESEEVQKYAIRCVSSLIKHNCTLQAASQIVSSGNLDRLLAFLEHQNQDITHNAFTLVFSLLEQHSFRPAFGNVGGIQLFLDYVKKENLISYHPDLISGLCLCCKEAVNRVKLREGGALQLFLCCLQCESYRGLHARVVSSLICFLYDDTSFHILLENRLVTVLLKQLRSYMNLSEVVVRSCALSDSTEKEDVHKGEGHCKVTGNSLNVRESKLQECPENIKSNVVAASERVVHVYESRQNVPEDTGKTGCDESKGQSGERSEGQQPEKSESQSRPVYSIDSPTYETQSNWDWESYTEGCKCKESFTPPHQIDNQYPGRTYSPISNISYYSPTLSSPEDSPSSSPEPGSSGPVYASYSPTYSIQSSPDTEAVDGLMSEDMTDILAKDSQQPNEGPVYESRNTEENSCDTRAEIVSVSVSEDKTNENSAQVLEPEDEKVDTNTKSEDFSKRSDEIDIFKHFHWSGDSAKQKQIDSKSSVMENNILILLSRVSQMTDPTSQLGTIEFIVSLLDYIALMKYPLSRAARLFSRVLRNPLCFESCLTLNIPVVIYRQLLQGEDIVQLLPEHLEANGSKRKSRTSAFLSPKTSDPSDSCFSDSDRFSMSEELTDKEDSQPVKRRRGEGESRGVVRELPGHLHKQEGGVCDAGRCGLAFLEDLSGVVDSSFGHGIVERLWHHGNELQRVKLSVCLLYILWSPGARSSYFSMPVLVLDLLEKCQCHSQLFSLSVQGLSLLAKVMRLGRPNNASSIGQLLDKFVDGRREEFSKHLVRNGISSVAGQIEENEVKLENSCLGPCNIDRNQCDVCFIVEGTKLYSVKSFLTQRSDIFKAMLSGQYKESTLSEIPISDTSKFAFEFILHYLHGCSTSCTVISDLFQGQVNTETAKRCISVLIEADKYFLTNLKSVVQSALQFRFISPGSALQVLEYSIIQECVCLQTASVVCVLVNSKSDQELVSTFEKFLKSPYASVFLQTLSNIFID